MIQRAASGLTRRTRHRVNSPLVSGDSCGFDVSAAAIHPPVSSIPLHRGSECAGKAIVPVQKKRALVRMAMPGQYQIDSSAFQDGQDILAHFNQLDLPVGVMTSFAVRRVMPISDEPFLG